MRILAVSPVAPWPATGGTLHRVASQLEALAALTGAAVDLLIVRQHDTQPFTRHEAVNLLGEVVLPVQHQFRGEQFARTVLQGAPLGLNRRIRGAIEESAASIDLSSYDLHWIFKAELAEFWPSSAVPLVVDMDDVEGRKVARGSAVVSARYPPALRPAVRLRDRRSSEAWSRLQSRVAARASRYLVCAEEDVRAFPHGTGQVVPNTIVNASTSASIAEEECRIIFHGTLTYPPNEDAVRSLLDDIAPLVWAQKPEAKFVVAGKLPDGLADTWQAEDRIEFTGFVPDMWAELAKATIVVAPIRYGGGTRVKLIEAAAAGKAVVSTPIGAEGLPFTQGSDIMLATGPSNFANAVVTLLDDRLLRHQLGSRARVSFEAAMSPIAVERAVEEVLRAVQTPTQTL